MPPGICHDFQKGRCNRRNCKFSHGPAAAHLSLSFSANQHSRETHEKTPAEELLRKWTFMIPKPNTNSSRFDAAPDTKKIFQMGLELTESEDAGVRQHVISKLGGEQGLAIIKNVTDTMDASQNGTASVSIFEDRTLPFFRIISHPDVRSSLILETPVNTIYTFLFGPSGRRGLSIFRFTVTALGELLSKSDEDLSIIAVSASLAVLRQLIDLNQTAQITEGFTAIVESMTALIPNNILSPDAQQNLTRIRQRLNIGSSLPLAPVHQGQSTTLTATFELKQDLPGALSTNGARHDNDHADINKIQILPTAQEVQSVRSEYLPFIDSSQNHLPGLAGVLDRQFRLLREDTVGQLRDAVREELVNLQHSNRISQTSQRGRQGVRRLIYQNIQFNSLYVDRRKGLQVVVAFDQPTQVKNKTAKQREDWWTSSKLLQVDSLVCFVSSHGKIIFFSVCDPKPSRRKNDHNSNHGNNTGHLEELSSLFDHPDRASVLLSLAEYEPQDAIWIGTHVGLQSTHRQSLVEFPGVLLPSFAPTLQALQKMSRTLDLPFADIIAPETSTAPVIKPPSYATRRGFQFNLDVLAKGLNLTLSQTFDYVKFGEGSTLDEAQQSAVIQALSTGLALIQGPPGTGKSYTGVAIIKALLHNRSEAKLGPIICVTYTNHALDQLLEHLVRDGVKQVIRLGSRSKSTLLEKLTLRNVAQEAEVTKAEKHNTWQHNRDIGECVEGLEGVLLGLNNPRSLANVRDYLERTNKRQYNELFGKGVDDDGFQEVQGKRFRAVESWLRNAPQKLTSKRPIGLLNNLSLKVMSTSERVKLYSHWIEQRAAELSNDLGSSLDSYYQSKEELDKCHQERDLRCLREAQIIGVTTSGLARNVEVLQRVHAKVMLCEEAGEVLEAHTLTAFLPSVEHAILIGDHEQLRPQINNYELQHDNPRGKKFALDMSLFERLVKPPTGDIQVPLSTLKTQRRMHPSISELVRVPLYVDLQDHPSVLEYPEVQGMRDRLYWLDHQAKEDAQNAQAISSSKTNSFEVEMAAALVSHLVKQGTYGHEDIAVLTPYLGQLQKLRKRLAKDFAIVVGDRDEDDLVAKGIEDDNATGVTIDLRVPVQKTTLLNALRIATVDNFQGEEAKVIVVSLVRSNDEQNCGFLKTSNRINVLLSRARHGMYIIGNSATSKHVPMWAQVLSIMERSNNIGPSLALCCPRHKDAPMNVSVPDDFSVHAPEGGCIKKCVSRLPCGHSCINMCHSTALHNAVRCLEDCPRTKNGCDHACPKRCGDKCDKLCQVQMSNIELPCGHVATKLKCWEAQATDKVLCRVKVDQIMTGCNHAIKVRCHEVPLGIEHPCSAICGAILPCGHNCAEKCKECVTKAEGSVVSTVHGTCNTRCGRPYTTCNHSCQVPCHGDEPCELCNNICGVTCSHSKCMKKCHEACSPCAEVCSWSCPHRGQCSLPCAVPCDMLPCSERCPKTLICGHRCPSICGEICPPVHYCQTCGKEDVKEMTVDYIMMSTYGEVNLDEEPCIIPPCGHILTLESMDGHMSMSDLYTITDGSIVGLKDDVRPFSASEMRVCPTCRGSLQNLNRYSRIVRRALIDEATKKFIVWANKGFIPLVSSMQMVETALRDRVGANQAAIMLPLEQSKPIQVTGTRDEQFNLIVKTVRRDNIYSALFKLRTAIKYFLQQVDEKEQPFGRIYDLVQHARRNRGIEVNINTSVDILQVRNRLLTTVLMIRCDYSLLLTFLEGQKGNAGNSSTIQVDLNINRQECEGLISESLSRNQPGSAVEGHLYWARYLVLERSFKEPSDQLDQLVEAAKVHLQNAYQICIKYPGQTAGMKVEVEELKKMLRGSTFYLPVSNEEKAAVYAAMARDFRGTGHWYYCENGHPFTVGECGMPMETSVCPQCGERVGGTDHRAVAGVTAATDLEAQFRGLVV